MTRSSVAALLLGLALAASARAATVEFVVADTKKQSVPDAVVSLVPLDVPAVVKPPTAPVQILQKKQEFVPYVTPVVVGTAVLFHNRDTLQHHVYSLSKPKKFELPLYAGDAETSVVFDQPGVVALGCNIHDWMSAYVVVLGTPWFGLTGSGGHAKVANVPAGRYRAEIWHPRLAAVETREVTIVEGSATPLDFSLTLKPDKRVRRPKTGGYYK